MKPVILRCMVSQSGDLYIASCLSLALAAQANTIEEAKAKLQAQVEDVIQEARENPKYAKDILTRKAPLSMWVEYWLCSGIYQIKRLFNHGNSGVEFFLEKCLV